MKINPLIVVALEEELGNKKLDDFDLLVTGIGKVNASLSLTLKLKNSSENYNSIINFGTAGSNYLEPGSFVDCTKFIQRDMDCTPLGFPEFQTPFEDNIEINFYDYKNNFNPLNNNLTCYTGDSFVNQKKEYKGVFDMEAYSLAKVSKFFNIPFISFKYISDGADSNSSSDWNANISSGYQKFSQLVLEKIVQYNELNNQ
tara:strand:+ start:534 stop:1133 length:600 start_codon:yes stop_codon:yes gene_type:complete